MAMELEAVRRLVQERGSDLAFVVNHSGGKDSTRMLGFVRNKFRDSPTHVVMADTGFEHQRPISAADFARHWCAEFGLNLTVVRNPKRTYLEMVERRGMFPSPKFRQCTSDLKRSPIEKFIRTLPHKMIVNCIGIRAEESHSRSRLAPLAVNASLTTRHRTVYNWLPIFDESLADVLAWHWVQWYMLSFEGCEDQFTSEKFDRAFSEYDLFRLVEQPGLLLSEFQPATA